jgi:hypothetical protein
MTSATAMETACSDVNVTTILEQDDKADHDENDLRGEVLATESEGLSVAQIKASEQADTVRDAANPRNIQPAIRRPADTPDNIVFDPAWIAPWPQTSAEVTRPIPSLPRSAGISRSRGSDPFGSWNRTVDNGPFCFMGFRRHFQPESSVPQDGPIDRREWSRMELGDGRWRISVVPGPSPVLGRSMPHMVP